MVVIPGDRKALCDMTLQRARRLYSIAVRSVLNGDAGYAAKLCKLAYTLFTASRCSKPRFIRKGYGICAKCYVPLIPGITASYRLRGRGKLRWIVVRCLICGYIHRRPYK